MGHAGHEQGPLIGAQRTERVQKRIEVIRSTHRSPTPEATIVAMVKSVHVAVEFTGADHGAVGRPVAATAWRPAARCGELDARMSGVSVRGWTGVQDKSRWAVDVLAGEEAWMGRGDANTKRFHPVVTTRQMSSSPGGSSGRHVVILGGSA